MRIERGVDALLQLLELRLQQLTGLEADTLPDSGFDLERHVREIERQYITEALRRTDGVKVKAAELLGMSFRSFRYYAKKYGL